MCGHGDRGEKHVCVYAFPHSSTVHTIIKLKILHNGGGGVCVCVWGCISKTIASFSDTKVPVYS